jgi:hypothetical protein
VRHGCRDAAATAIVCAALWPCVALKEEAADAAAAAGGADTNANHADRGIIKFGYRSSRAPWLQGWTLLAAVRHGCRDAADTATASVCATLWPCVAPNGEATDAAAAAGEADTNPNHADRGIIKCAGLQLCEAPSATAIAPITSFGVAVVLLWSGNQFKAAPEGRFEKH